MKLDFMIKRSQRRTQMGETPGCTGQFGHRCCRGWCQSGATAPADAWLLATVVVAIGRHSEDGLHLSGAVLGADACQRDRVIRRSCSHLSLVSRVGSSLMPTTAIACAVARICSAVMAAGRFGAPAVLRNSALRWAPGARSHKTRARWRFHPCASGSPLHCRSSPYRR